MKVLTFLIILLWGTACNGQVKKDLPKEKEHPKLIKTLGGPRYGNVQCILQDKASNLWFGTTQNGLYKYDGKSFTSFEFPNNGFTRIIEDKKGNLWFGGEGIHRFDGKTFTHFSTKDGLINPWVWSILEDKSGNIWVGTRETGLYLFDGKRFISYSE